MHNIHIFVPPLKDNQGFIPVTHLWLKSYYEEHGKNIDKIHWVTPIVDWTEEQLWQHILDNPPSIWGFGGYIWNIKLCYRMAKRVKENFPDCLIVAGGPQPEYKHDQEYFKKYPYIDLVVPGDGEIPFTDIIDTYLGDKDYTNCREVVVPTDNGWIKSKNTFNVLKDWDWPKNYVKTQYHEIKKIIDQYKSNDENKTIYLLYETMKGCPYACVFCDWGGGIHTKVRQKDVEEVKKDLNLIADLGIRSIGISDANFGILSRDVDLAKYIVDLNAFDSVFFHAAKNNKDRVMEITKMFYEAGLTNMHLIDLQDFNDDILKNIKRFEIPWEKHLKYVYDLTQETGLKTVYVNTLLGLPGQNMSTLIADVDNFGKHNFGYSRYIKWMMLPNSPGNDPAYREEFKIKTKQAYLAPFPVGVKSEVDRYFGNAAAFFEDDIIRDSVTEIITETMSFSQKDYLEMIHFVGTVYACHVNGLLTYFTHGLYHLNNINYSEFYRRFFYEFLPKATGSIRRLHDHLTATLEKNINKEYFMIGAENPDFGKDFPFYFQPEIYLLSGYAWNSAELYQQIYDWLEPELDDRMKDLFNYNKNIFLSPNYNPTVGRQWKNTYDWHSWFSKYFTGITLAKVTDQPKKILSHYAASDTHTAYGFGDPLPILWHNETSNSEKLLEYFYKTCYGTKMHKVLSKIRISYE